jgi:hypothetical protein
MHDLAKLNELAGYEIEDLIKAGITPTPAEIVELSAIGWQVQTPDVRRELARGVPVAVGNTHLWPLTMYASDWYHRIGCNIGLDELALGYAMASGYTEEILPESKNVARRAVKAWAHTCRVRKKALRVAISQVLQQDEDYELPPDEDGPATPSVGEISARIAALCPGASPEFWERRCSYKYALDVLNCAVEQMNESGRPLPTSPVITATRALGWAVEKIKQRHEKENG